MTNEIAARLDALRVQMAELELDALLVPRADEYLGEYMPAHNERLQWVSGFTGSAGVVIVLREAAAIFVDGRYTVQVRQQVDASLFDILHLVEEPHVNWLAQQLSAGAKVGCDARTHSFRWYKDAQATLAAQNVELVSLAHNLVDACWHDRPRSPLRPALLLPENYSGRASLEKRQQIGKQVAERGAEAALIFAADSVNWLLNIRGADVPCLPLVLGMGLLYSDGRLQFFTNPEKIPEGFAEHVGEGVEVRDEAAAADAFARLEGCAVLADPLTANAWCHLALLEAGADLVAANDPVLLPKACKNEVEVQGMRDAHRRDGVAEVRFLAWLDREVEAGRLHDEATLSDQLYTFRAEQALFQETSFDTISAAAGNAAMCHYNHLNGTPAQLLADSVYLVDSGGQYLDGTTDITRTVAIGDAGDEARKMFTLVLKGHMALDQARFPEGTTGSQLDVLARQFLWAAGHDYDHGTGHGVGCFLSVHEGPQRIAKVASEVALRPGMVVSNEPGYYKSDAYGMRCENLCVVRDMGKADGAQRTTLGFESITLAPFDKRMLEPGLLSEAETRWLNSYHERVLTSLSPLLNDDDRTWLQQATAPLPV